MYWFVCPICGKKICKLTEDAIAKGVFVKCKMCKQEIEIKAGLKRE